MLVVSSSFFTKTLVSKQKFLKSSETATQTNRVTITVPVRCFCGGSLRQFFYRMDCSFPPKRVCTLEQVFLSSLTKNRSLVNCARRFFLLAKENNKQTKQTSNLILPHRKMRKQLKTRVNLKKYCLRTHEARSEDDATRLQHHRRL